MSAPPQTEPSAPTPTAAYPEPTPADHEAMFASVVWFRSQVWAGLAEKYQGLHVALLGDKVLDADRDPDELVRRVELLGDTICQTRVVLQYVHRAEDWNWK